MLTRKYKTRFVFKVGEHLKSIEVTDILFFFSLEKATFAKLAMDGKIFLILRWINWKKVLDPQHFFRINRKYIVSADFDSGYDQLYE